MKITKKQLRRIIKEALERVISQNEKPELITSTPLVWAVVKRLVSLDDFEFEHPYSSLDDLGGDEWAHAEQDAVRSSFQVGYLPEDIVLPRKRYNLVARTGWYLLEWGLESRYVHGPFAEKEDVQPLKGTREDAGYEYTQG